MATFKGVTTRKNDKQKENLILIVNHIEEIDYYVSRVINGANIFAIDKQYFEDVLQELKSYLSKNALEIEWLGEIETDEVTHDLLEKIRNFK
jgi:hypothetical protein